jgi:hypothetical protein
MSPRDPASLGGSSFAAAAAALAAPSPFAAAAAALAPARRSRARRSAPRSVRVAPPRDAGPAITLQEFLAIPADQRPLFVVSDGMGVDSTAMLVALKRLGLRPDVIMHADTGDEYPETVAYREARRAWLRRVGFPDLTMVKRAPSRSGRTGKSFSTLAEKCIANETLTGIAFGGKSCSVEWKIKPQERFLRGHAGARATWASGRRVVKAIGYDIGPIDSRRAHHLTSDRWYNYVYPLRELGWDRERAIAEIRAEGLPVPRKSSCYHCSAQKPWELAELVRDWPELADRIIAVEEAAAPRVRKREGLWGKTVKGKRGAIPRPGSMTVFIRQLRADPALIDHYLALKPVPKSVRGVRLGGIPEFRAAPPSRRRHLAVVHDAPPSLAA